MRFVAAAVAAVVVAVGSSAGGVDSATLEPVVGSEKRGEELKEKSEDFLSALLSLLASIAAVVVAAVWRI